MTEERIMEQKDGIFNEEIYICERYNLIIPK